MGIANLSGLDALKMAANADLDKKSNSTEDEDIQASFELDPSVNIPDATFRQAFSDYTSMLSAANNKVHLLSILGSCPTQLHHNKWELTIGNMVQKNILERDQEMVPFFRSALKTPNLFLELILNETYVNPDDEKPYTEEEKLKEMEAKNPVLLDFQKTFRTRIIYQ